MKKRLSFIPTFVCLLCLIGISASAQKKTAAAAPQLGKAPLKDVIKSLTLEEKAKLVVGMGFKMPAMRPPRQKKDTAGAKTIAAATPPAFTLQPTDPKDDIPEKGQGAAGRTHVIKRLGIPSITVSDGPSGVMIDPIRNGDSSKTYYATAFP